MKLTKRAAKLFRNVKADAKRVLEQLLQSPAEAEVEIPNTKNRVKLKLNRNLAAEAIRYMLYSPGPRQPRSARAASRRGRQLWSTRERRVSLSHVSRRDRKQRDVSLGYLRGRSTVRQSRRGGKTRRQHFPRRLSLSRSKRRLRLMAQRIERSEISEPVRSNKPVLIVTGEWDPVTPPAHGDAVAKTLSNSMHVVVPDGAHGLAGLENINCLDRIIAQFISSGAVKDLDTGCVTSIRRRGFALQ